MKIVKTECVAAKGKYIARKGTNDYFTRCTILQGETIDSFVEVSEIPKTIDETQYIERVRSRIHERYSIDDEMALVRQRDTKPEEFKAYDEYCEKCKADVKLEIAKEEKEPPVVNKEGEEMKEISPSQPINFFN